MLRKIFLSFFIFLLAACGDEAPEIKADNDSPEYKATEFFYAILIEDDLNKAMNASLPKYARIIKSYGSTKQFARNILNMRFDEVEIEIDHGSRSVRKRFGDSAVLNVILHGKHNGNKIADMRQVRLTKVKGKWYIEKVLDDPYAR
ncbi:hypothetical protein [Pseudoalteromonas sp.]|uniref:hypothetical protein n=1 Tax=Pseudoalteromonas sp. TaxID=53249 RepID=UPI003565EED0